MNANAACNQRGSFPTRRHGCVITILALTLTLLTALVPGSTRVAAAANEVGPERIYFPQTGHYLAYGFLAYWHTNGGITTFGYPITEELQDPASGLTIQYFERAVFEYHPGAAPGWSVQLQRLGATQTASRANEPPFQPIVAANNANTTYYPQTGHTLAFGFRAFWQSHGGLPIFGYPISQEFTEQGLTVQYFERARFEYHPGNPPQYQILLGLLGSNAAQHAGVNQASVPKSATVPVYNPGLWYVPAPAPSGPEGVTTPPPGAPTGQAKWIEVDLSSQYLRAWEHNQLVFGTYVSTGVPAHPTPTGTFQIYAKLRYDDMSGGTPGVDYYNLPNVPYVMYFYQAYALHGTYWHHNFGHVMSHGCVNLPTDAAGWVYNWAPIGTVVWIHY
ncbi:MAG TPA: L,D-transpeptidase [Thermomicrobiaceae bacterium]|nr:L,D-transpeptidase [Thermomicrobiaceae bacterium]